jgi:hypothetical protein
MSEQPEIIRMDLLHFGQRRSAAIQQRCKIIAINLQLLAENPRPELLKKTQANVEGLRLLLSSSAARRTR